MKDHPFDFSRVALVGGGKSGTAALERLQELDVEIVVVEDDEVRREALRRDLEDVPVPSTEEFLVRYGLDWSTVAVVSPGVRPSHPLVAGAGCVISEAELGYLCTNAEIAAITGTNGKTTVTRMITAMLRQGGLDAVGCGNLGLPLTSLSPSVAIAVVELSSFQLLHCETFHAQVALWTNFSPDHLDYHGDIAHYKAAKERIFRHQSPEDLRVLNADDPEVVSSQRSPGARELWFSLNDTTSYGLRGEEVIVAGEVLVKTSEMKRTLPHELANLLGASAVARDFGVNRSVVAEYFLQYQGFEHRIEPVGMVGGIGFFNDSKATTPASTLAAANALPSSIIAIGGRNKGLDLTPLGALCERAEGLVLVGESAAALEELFSSCAPSLPRVHAATMSEVVQHGFELAQRVGARSVVLSPGGTSFDWYENYQMRGEAFKGEVLRLAQRARTGGGE